MTDQEKQQLRTAWLARGISVPEHIWERAHMWVVDRPLRENASSRLAGAGRHCVLEPAGVTIFTLYDDAGRQIFQEGKPND